MSRSPPPGSRLAGRYDLLEEIASGGMATVHLARLAGPGGFSHTVAVKRLHPQFAKSPEFVAMFLDEARLAARVRHANVARVFEVFLEQGELFLVMEYVEGPSLDRLAATCRRHDRLLPRPVAAAIVHGALMGLHAAHEAKDDEGKALFIVHRDVSPHNVLVGLDGVPRIVDFGIAKAESRLGSTRDGQVKGKFAYMSPEQVKAEDVDRRTDVFAMGIVLWELLTGRRLYEAPSDGASVMRIVHDDAPLVSSVVPDVEPALDAVVKKALEKRPGDRFASARDFARALEAAVRVATPGEVATFVEGMDASELGGARRTKPRLEEGTLDFAVSSQAARPASEAAGVSEATPEIPNGPTRVDARVVRRGAILPWAVTFAAVGGAAAFVAWSRPPSPSPGVPPSPTSTQTAPTHDVPSVAVTTTSSAVVEPPLVVPVASAPDVPPPSSAWRGPPRPATAFPPRTSCNPPYDVLPSGAKRYKRECVR